jgi:hypothetical protein
VIGYGKVRKAYRASSGLWRTLADSEGGGNPSGTEVPNSQETRTARASIRLRIRNSQDSKELKTTSEFWEGAPYPQLLRHGSPPQQNLLVNGSSSTSSYLPCLLNRAVALPRQTVSEVLLSSSRYHVTLPAPCLRSNNRSAQRMTLPQQNLLANGSSSTSYNLPCLLNLAVTPYRVGPCWRCCYRRHGIMWPYLRLIVNS